MSNDSKAGRFPMAVRALVLVGVVGACTTPVESTTTTTTTTTTAVVTTTTVALPGLNARYESVFDMRVLMESSGFRCSTWEVGGDDEWSIEGAECTEQLTLAVYENASLIREHRDFRNILLFAVLDLDFVYDLAGPNWNVHCGSHRSLCEELLPILGGEIIVSTPPE